MKKRILTCLLFSFFLSSVCLAQPIKKPVVSGSFYPDSPKILAEKVKQFLGWVEIKETEKNILAIISPHAGYDYSGSVAAYGYKAVRLKPFRTVIIIGPSHYEYFEGISVYPQGAWQTPLGNVSCDAELANALIRYDSRISFYEPAFRQEHSVEVELPFLQIVLDNFQIVPIVMGKFTYENCQLLSQALLEVTKDRSDILVVASTDMSHYHPYEEACEIDQQTIKELKNFNPQSLYYKLASEESQLCGAAAVITTLLYAQGKGATEIEVLKYANSGDVTGDKSKVVGYLSAAIYAPEAFMPKAQTQGDVVQPAEGQMFNEDKLNEQQKKRLLEIARRTIEEYLASGKRMEVNEDDPLLCKNMGAFVTIHKQGALRGCIGNIIGQQPLYLTVRDMAIEAATDDPRFTPVAPEELPNIEIEISVLSEPKEVEDVAQIKMGVHGVIVKRGFASGVFLPQVATETGWSREEFLSNLCAHKAGLSPDAWKDKQTQLHSFTAQVFGEKDKK